MITCQYDYRRCHQRAWMDSNALVVIVDNLFSVIHATVADLDGIAIKDFSELVVFRKVFVY